MAIETKCDDGHSIKGLNIELEQLHALHGEAGRASSLTQHGWHGVQG